MQLAQRPGSNQHLGLVRGFLQLDSIAGRYYDKKTFSPGTFIIDRTAERGCQERHNEWSVGNMQELSRRLGEEAAI